MTSSRTFGFSVGAFLSSSTLLLTAMVASFVVTGCANTPTETHDNPERRMVPVPQAGALHLNPETVVLDTRTPFEFSTGHIPKSFNIQWGDFCEPQAAQHGILQADTFAIARRLTRLGVDPTSNIVIVGKGFSGNGEEGRIAWMLAYLGVNDLRFAALQAFRGHLTTEPGEPDKNAKIWKPVLDESLTVTRAELQAAMNKHASVTPLSFRDGQPAQIYRIIDVRDEKDYIGREGFGAAKHVPNMEAVNIPWKQFFDPLLRPSLSMVGKLRDIGLHSQDRIIVVGVDGVSSAAVTMALRSMGYLSAGNYAGGLQDLMSAYGAGGGSAGGSGASPAGAGASPSGAGKLPNGAGAASTGARPSDSAGRPAASDSKDLSAED